MRKLIFILLLCCLIMPVMGDTIITNATYNRWVMNNPLPNDTWLITKAGYGATGVGGTMTTTCSNLVFSSFPTDIYHAEYRCGMSFNYTPLIDKTITSANLTLYLASYSSTLGASKLSVVDFTPINPHVYVGDDFNKTSFTRYAPDVVHTTTINNSIIFTFNDAGKTALNNENGYISFYILNNRTIDDNYIFALNATSGIGVRPKEFGGGILAPRLIIEYSDVDNSPPDSITDLTGIGHGTNATWAWTNPEDEDYNYAYVLLNNVFYQNVSTPTNSLEIINLYPKTQYTLSIQTVDSQGNLNSEWVNSTITTSEKVVLVGDSIIQGLGRQYNGLNGMTGYIYDDKPLWTIENHGYGGRKTIDLLTATNFSYDVIDSNATIIIYECGINDVTTGRDAEWIIMNMLEYSNMVTGNGTKIYFNTIIPHSSNYQIILDVNNWLRTNYTPNHNCNYYFDLFETLEDGDNPNNILPAYTYDGTHLTVEGFEAWGENMNYDFPDIGVCGEPTPTPTPTTTATPTATPTPLANCGNLTVSVSEKTDNYILWSWNTSQNITSVYADGILVSGLDTSLGKYVLNDIQPNSYHYIKIQADNETGCSFVNSAGSTTTATETFYSNLNLWILVLLALLFLIGATVTGINLLGYISVLFSFLGILTSIGNSFITGAIFVIMFCAGALIAYEW